MWNNLKTIFCKKDNNKKSDNWIFGTMLFFGLLALLASFVLTVEEIYLLKNPDAQLSCNINIILNCATVMKTWQASLLGFPNMLIGLMTFPVVIAAAALGLSQAKLPRWFWLSANLGFLVSMLFAFWLFFQSLYVIETLCPWCLTVTLSTTIIFSTMTHYSIRENIFQLDSKTYKKLLQWQNRDYGKLVTAGVIALFVILVFLKYGNSLFA